MFVNLLVSNLLSMLLTSRWQKLVKIYVHGAEYSC